MNLVFIRHAIAVDREDPDVRNDAERWLTQKGIKRMEQAAKGMVQFIPALDVIVTSPYKRAKQTAEIVAKAYRKQPTIIENELLSPGAHLDDLAKILLAQPLMEHVAIVGHEPDFSEMISALLYEYSLANIEMKKGAVAGIQIGDKLRAGTGRLLYHLPPKLLRLLGNQA